MELQVREGGEGAEGSEGGVVRRESEITAPSESHQTLIPEIHEP